GINPRDITVGKRTDVIESRSAQPILPVRWSQRKGDSNQACYDEYEQDGFYHSAFLRWFGPQQRQVLAYGMVCRGKFFNRRLHVGMSLQRSPVHSRFFA